MLDDWWPAEAAETAVAPLDHPWTPCQVSFKAATLDVIHSLSHCFLRARGVVDEDGRVWAGCLPARCSRKWECSLGTVSEWRTRGIAAFFNCMHYLMKALHASITPRLGHDLSHSIEFFVLENTLPWSREVGASRNHADEKYAFVHSQSVCICNYERQELNIVILPSLKCLKTILRIVG